MQFGEIFRDPWFLKYYFPTPNVLVKEKATWVVKLINWLPKLMCSQKAVGFSCRLGTDMHSNFDVLENSLPSETSGVRVASPLYCKQYDGTDEGFYYKPNRKYYC